MKAKWGGFRPTYQSDEKAAAKLKLLSLGLLGLFSRLRIVHTGTRSELENIRGMGTHLKFGAVVRPPETHERLAEDGDCAAGWYCAKARGRGEDGSGISIGSVRVRNSYISKHTEGVVPVACKKPAYIHCPRSHIYARVEVEERVHTPFAHPTVHVMP